jgi:hypothetical protein
MKDKVKHETSLHPGPLATAPSPASAGSRRIIPNDRPTHLRGPTPSGTAQSAVPGTRKTPVQMSYSWACEDGVEQMFDGGRHETGLGALGPGRPRQPRLRRFFWGVGLTECRKDTQADEERRDVDIARSEHVEAELDGLITRRHDKRRTEEGERPAEEAWVESERRYAQQRRAANRAAWASYHRQQAERHRATLTDLVAHHLARAEMYTADTNEHHHEEDSCSSSSTRNAK